MIEHATLIGQLAEVREHIEDALSALPHAMAGTRALLDDALSEVEKELDEVQDVVDAENEA